jgi:catechol 2,3-dioxygenase-like lactoylglutathione lyase family enzyme
MKRVTGIGGVFFKASDPQQTYDWYQKHLGIDPMPDGSSAIFRWRDAHDPEKKGTTVWAAFRRDTKYFGEGAQMFMVNYRVENLDELLEALKAEGVEVDPKRENYDYGKFAWIIDPDGNRIELWEPPNPEMWPE